MKNKLIKSLILLSSVVSLGACGGNNEEEKAPTLSANVTTMSHRDATQLGFEISFSDFDLAKHPLSDVKMHSNDETAFKFEASSTINGYYATAKKSGTFTVWGTLNNKESNKLTLTIGEAQFANVNFGFNDNIQITYEKTEDSITNTFTLTKIGNCYMASVSSGAEFFYDASGTNKYLYGFDRNKNSWVIASTNPSEVVLEAGLFRFLTLTNNDEYVSKKSEALTIGGSAYSVDTYTYSNESYSYHDGSDFACVLKASRNDGINVNVTNIDKSVTEFPFEAPEK